MPRILWCLFADTLVCGDDASDVLVGERMNLSCSMNYSGAFSAWDVSWTHDDIKLTSIDYDKPGSYTANGSTNKTGPFIVCMSL